MMRLRSAVVLAVLLVGCAGEAGRDAAPGDAVTPSAPKVSLGGESLGDRLIAAIQVGKGPGGLAAGFGSVWVENHRASSVSRVDPATNEVVAEIPAGEHTCGLIVTDDAIWVPSFDGIRRIDPETNEVAQTIETWSCGVVLERGLLWSVGEDNVLRSFDPATGEETKHMKVGREAGVKAFDGEVWVLDATPELWRIDPATAKVRQKIRVAELAPYWSDLSFGHGAVFISVAGVLERRNLATLDVEESVDLGTQPLWLSPGSDSLWVTAANREEVLRMDPETLEVSETLKTGDYSGWLVEAFGDGWISNLESNAVYRVSLEPKSP